MKVKLNGQEYAVLVHYINPGSKYQPMFAIAKGRGTIVSLVKYESKDDLKVIANGYSFCHPNDSFVKKVGRKLAFTKLVNSLWNLNIIHTKEERKYLWETFFQNFKM